MIFRLLPAICKILKGQPDDAIIVVFVPLLSIVVDQVEAANRLSESLGLRAYALSLSEYKSIENGLYNILIGTTEA